VPIGGLETTVEGFILRRTIQTQSRWRRLPSRPQQPKKILPRDTAGEECPTTGADVPREISSP
jgi:hypothetical protein